MKLARIFNVLMLSALLFAGGCAKDDGGSGVPFAAVNISIILSQPEFINLSVVGGWEYITGGSRGLLVYRLTNDQFIAYDRHCTYNPADNCARVEVDPSTLLVFDDCCGSEFAITDGSVLNGPASIPLKQYGTTFDGNILRIFN